MKPKLRIILLIVVLLSIYTLVADPADIEEGGIISGELTPEQQAQLAYANIYNPKDPTYFSWNWGDYKTIPDWSKLTDDQWKKIPQNRVKEIPADQLDYFKLSAEQRKGMTAEQIALNFDKINDLTKDVNQQEAEKAIKEKYDVEVKLGKGAQLKNGVLSATYGEKGEVTLTGYSYKLGQLTINEEGRIVFTPSLQQNEILIPDTDIVTVDTEERTLNYQGNSIKGRLHFEKGRRYIMLEPAALRETGQEEIITINNLGVSFNAAAFQQYQEQIMQEPAQSWQINVFFDGEKHEGTYLSVDTAGRKMHFAGGLNQNLNYYQLDFKPGNPFFNIDENDRLSMSFGSDAEVSVQGRTGKAPVVTVQLGPRSRPIFLRNGNSGFSMSKAPGKEFYQVIGEGAKDSVPFTLLVQDKEGKNLLIDEEYAPERFGEGEPKKTPMKVIFGDHNLYGYAKESLPEEEYKGPGSRVYYDEEGIKAVRLLLALRPEAIREAQLKQIGKTTKINVLNLPRLDPALVEHIYRNLQYLPVEVRNSIHELHIVPDEQIENFCLAKVGGCAITGGRVYIAESEVAYWNVLYHEAVHTWDFEKNDESPMRNELNMLLLKEQREGREGPGGLSKEEQERLTALKEEYIIEKIGETLDERWEAAFGLVLRADLGPTSVVTSTPIIGTLRRLLRIGLATTWADGTSGPRHGCVHPYACNNLRELKAMTAETAAQGDAPAIFAPLIDPKSEQYDVRFRIALDLVREEGFISEEAYKRIISSVEGK